MLLYANIIFKAIRKCQLLLRAADAASLYTATKRAGFVDSPFLNPLTEKHI